MILAFGWHVTRHLFTRWLNVNKGVKTFWALKESTNRQNLRSYLVGLERLVYSNVMGVNLFKTKFFQLKMVGEVRTDGRFPKYVVGLAVSPCWHHAPTLRSKTTHWKLLTGEPSWTAPMVNKDSSSCYRRGGLLFTRCFPALYILDGGWVGYMRCYSAL